MTDQEEKNAYGCLWIISWLLLAIAFGDDLMKYSVDHFAASYGSSFRLPLSEATAILGIIFFEKVWLPLALVIWVLSWI